MERLKNLRAENRPAPAPEKRKVTLRLAVDVTEALYVGKARGLGTLAEQIEALVRAREAAAEG